MIDREVHQVSEFSSITSFLNADQVRPGILTIQDGKLPIDILVSPASSRTTICFFHGAIERHFTLPVLSGLGISGGIDANRIFISDPSLILDQELMLSWYAGNKQQPKLQRDLTSILNKILESLGTERIIFFGGSGGGFASLYFARQFPHSLALVFNPQTNIAKYTDQAVQDFAKKAFDIEADLSNPLSQLPRTVIWDLCELYKTSTNTKIAYMQNLNDEVHFRSHLVPFLTTIHPATEVVLLAKKWRDGHSPPPKELLSDILNLSVSATDLISDLCNIGFENVTGPKNRVVDQFSGHSA